MLANNISYFHQFLVLHLDGFMQKKKKKILGISDIFSYQLHKIINLTIELHDICIKSWPQQVNKSDILIYGNFRGILGRSFFSKGIAVWRSTDSFVMCNKRHTGKLAGVIISIVS